MLSEMPGEWERQLRHWRDQNSRHKQIVNDEPVPDPNSEYFLYQTLIGALPFEGAGAPDFIERIKDYMLKSAREAKTHTFWLDNNSDYEKALLGFTESVLKDDGFIESLAAFQEQIAHYGVFNSLSQLLLKVTSPGLPDFYQGSELWDLNLVNPDNRRPIDYEKRASLAAEIRRREQSDLPSLIRELLSAPEDGRVKLFATMRALAARNRNREVFEGGEYIPLIATGERAENLVAFARRGGKRWGVTIAPRLMARVIDAGEMPLGAPVWLDTRIEIPAGAPLTWKDTFLGEVIDSRDGIRIGDALSLFPLGLLIGESGA